MLLEGAHFSPITREEHAEILSKLTSLGYKIIAAESWEAYARAGSIEIIASNWPFPRNLNQTLRKLEGAGLMYVGYSILNLSGQINGLYVRRIKDEQEFNKKFIRNQCRVVRKWCRLACIKEENHIGSHKDYAGKWDAKWQLWLIKFIPYYKKQRPWIK